MAQNKVDVSVLILSYNSAGYIEQCIKSVLNQKTKYVYEIIVVDDCSTDDSWSIIERIKQTSDTVAISTHRNNRNLGSLGNLKCGLLHCHGRYIAYLEGDDYWTDIHKLENQVNALENSSYVGIGGGCLFVDRYNEPIEQKYYHIDAETVLSNGDLWNFPPFQTSTFMFKNVDLNIPESLPNHSAYNDKVLYLLTSLQGEILYRPNVVSAYRFHEANLSHKLSLKNVYQQHLHANRLILKHLGRKYLFQYLRSVLQYKIQYFKALH